VGSTVRGRTGLRFPAPSVEISPEMGWAFNHAFADEPRSSGAEYLPEVSVDHAFRFGLAARIGARCEWSRLVSQLGEKAANELIAVHKQSVVSELRHRSVIRMIQQVSERLGIQAVFIKGAALFIDNTSILGSRLTTDVDVLVAASEAGGLQNVLIARGWIEAADTEEKEHQLQTLHHPSGAMIEVHCAFRGVHSDSTQRGLSLKDVCDLGLTRTVVVEDLSMTIPCREVLIANALVHGIAQHGYLPLTYPLTQMIADVQDLGVSDEREAAFWKTGFPLISKNISRAEVASVFDLAQRLSLGEPLVEIECSQTAAGRLLRHVIAGLTDSRYRDSLVFRSVLDPLPTTSRAAAQMTSIRHVIWPNRKGMADRFGHGKLQNMPLWIWRVFRPLHLTWVLVRIVKNWLSTKIRRTYHRHSTQSSS